MDTHAPTLLGTILKAIVCTPNRNFDTDAYERDVIEPTRKIRTWAGESGEAPPDAARAREAFAILASILDAKGVDPEERDDRLREIADLFGLEPPGVATDLRG